MAKEYKKKLTLQDNFSEVCKKAAAETKKLIQAVERVNKTSITPKVDSKAVRAFEKDLQRAGKQQILVKAKLDSSVHSTMNQINKTIVPNKVIRLQVKDDVTRSVTNLERHLFSVQNRLQTGLKNPFKSFNASGLSALSTASALSNVMRVLGNGAAATGMIAPLLGGAAAGRALGGNRVIAGALGQREDGRTPPSTPRQAGKGFFGAIRGGIYDTASKFKNHQSGYIEDSDVLTQVPGVSHAWDDDSNYAKMINRQKARMGQLGGPANYLGKYQQMNLSVPGTDEMFSGMVKMQNRAQLASVAVKNYMQDTATKINTTLGNATNKVFNSKFANKARTAFDAVSNYGLRAGTRIGFAFQRGGYHASTAISKVVLKASAIGSKIKAIALKIQDSKVVKALGTITSKIKSIAGKSFSFAMNMTGNALKGIGKFAGGALMAGGAAALAGLGVGIKGASDTEQNKVSMAHFIGVANGKGSGDKGTQASTDAYMAQLNKMANKTPFSNSEIMDAGRRAVNVTGGDTAKAMELTKLAGDMAALNPGKSVMDAMEALADLKNGEAERMKEFGMKLSAEDIAAAGGDLTKMKQKGGKTIGQQFAGGADKLSGTAAGQWSTLTGNAQSTLTKFGSTILPALTSGLGTINAWFDKNEQKINGWVTKFGAGFNKAITFIKPITSAIGQFFSGVGAGGPVVSGIFGHITKSIGVVSKVIGYLGEIWTGLWPTIQSVMGTAWKIIQPILSTMVSLASSVADIFMLAWPGIKTTIEGVWNFVKPILDLFGEALEKVSKFAGWVADKLSGALEKKKAAEAENAKETPGARKAAGISYVPRNDFFARLHEGERVLTKGENRSYGQGGGNSIKVDVHVNGAQDAKAVAREVVQEIQRVTLNLGGKPNGIPA